MFEGELCHQRLLECIKQGLNEEANVHLRNVPNIVSLIDTSRSTLLHYSSKCKNTTMVQDLIGLGCEVNAVNNFGFTPLMLAIQNADVMTVEILLQNNAYFFTEVSTLQLVVQCSINSAILVHDRQKYQLILDMIFEKVNNSFTRHKKSISRLILRCDDLDKFAVVAFGNVELAEIIIQNGHRIDLQEPTRGCTALHCSIIFAKVQNVELLMRHGANTFALNNMGLSPLHYYTWNLESVDIESNVLKSFLRYNSEMFLPNHSELAEVEYLFKYGNEETRNTIMIIGFDILANCTHVEETNLAKIAELLLLYGANAQTFDSYSGLAFIEILKIREQRLILHVFLENLAMYDYRQLTQLIRNTIESDTLMKFYFDHCKALLMKMDKVVAEESAVTLFKLLFESDRQLTAYARNESLRLSFRFILAIVPNTQLSYMNILQKRLKNALERAEFEGRIARIIEFLTGINADAFHKIVYKIINYLDIQDLNNLCRLEWNSMFHS